MYNTSVSTASGMPLSIRAATAQGAFALDRRNHKKAIRALLGHYGLRTSLIRLKVIDALLVAAGDGRCIGVNGAHAWLEQSAVECSFISVREVLKRLCDEGVIFYQADKSYSFTAEAWGILVKEAG